MNNGDINGVKNDREIRSNCMAALFGLHADGTGR